MNQKSLALRLLSAVLAVLLLGGCAAAPTAPSEITESTEAAEPIPTIPSDGNPDDATCRGSYTAADAEIRDAADTVVAIVGDADLTLKQLQVYYWMEVATYRQSDAEVEPDYSQSLDTQSCPLDDEVATWQQYFLKAALNTWHTQQALVLRAEQEGVPTEDAYNPDLEKHQAYLSDKPATKYLYGYSKQYRPNDLHQAYLDAIPEMLRTLSSDSGYTQVRQLAEAIAGEGVDFTSLVNYTRLSNHAYMYFTEMGYHFEPTAEDVEAFFTENQDMYDQQGIAKDGGKTVDIRHILLIPNNAEIGEDGSVSSSEEAWEACLTRAKSVKSKWKEAVQKTRFAQYAAFDPAEARFSEAAKNNSADEGSRANGGLYANIRKGQLAEPLDSWCFDPARQHGDTEIIRSSCGYHIVFFSGATEDWYAAAEADLIAQMSRDFVTETRETYPVTIRYSSIKLTQAEDNGSFVTASDLLYPDVAHERFPAMPLYLQQDYPDAPYGDYKVSTHGCGITTLAMVASYLADEELTPAELGARYGYYCGLRGTEICIFDDTPAEMGFQLMKRSYGWTEIRNAIENGQIVVVLEYAGYWTSGGHYIAITGITEDEKYVVRDSNLINYKRIPAHVQDAHTRGSITQSAQFFWIYEPKVKRIPACVRCSEDLTAGAPEVLFREDYLCPKCLAATTRRDTYLTGFAG